MAPLDNTLLIPKHPCRPCHLEGPPHSKSIGKVHNLSGGNASSNRFRSVSDSFNSSLMLGEPFNRSLIGKMEDASAGSSSSEILHHDGIFKDSGTDRIASWSSRHIMRKFLIGITIDTVGPIKGDMFQLRVIRKPVRNQISALGYFCRYPQMHWRQSR
jgi:hypothetical protein